MRAYRLTAIFLAASILVPLLGGCSSETPEQKLDRLRSGYSARLNGFIVQQEPAPDPLTDEAAGIEGEVVADEAAGTAGEEIEVEELPPIDLSQDILLDIIIRHDSPEMLPGVTVDISQVDAQQQEKGRWRVWFDMAGVPKATPRQFTHVLEDLDYQEGDGFHVEVRHPVPDDERSEYRELSPQG